MSSRAQRRERIAAVKAGHPGDGANRRRQARRDAAKSIEVMLEERAQHIEEEKRSAQREADAARWMEERRARERDRPPGSALRRLEMMTLALGGLGEHR